MAKYPAATWAALWVKNGGLPSKTREAVAVVMCESGGDTSATSPVGARGGWQFMPGTLSSDSCARNADCSTREAVKLSNRGRDFSAWDCHPDSVARSGTSTGDATYKRILADLKTPLGDVPFPGPDLDFTNPFGPLSPLPNPFDEFGLPHTKDPFPDASNPFEAVAEIGKYMKYIGAFFAGLGELVLTPEGWVRTGKILGGSIFILWGLRIVTKEVTGTDPVGTAKKAGEIAATAAVAKKLPI